MTKLFIFQSKNEPKQLFQKPHGALAKCEADACNYWSYLSRHNAICQRKVKVGNSNIWTTNIRSNICQAVQ